MRNLLLSLVCGLLIYTPLQADKAWSLENISQIAKQGEIETALKQVNEYLVENPQDKRAYKLRAHLYFKQSKYDEALKDFSQVVRLSSDNANAFVERATAYLAMKDYEAALADIEQALAIKPKSSCALLLKESILRAQKKTPILKNFRIRSKGEPLKK